MNKYFLSLACVALLVGCEGKEEPYYKTVSYEEEMEIHSVYLDDIDSPRDFFLAVSGAVEFRKKYFDSVGGDEEMFIKLPMVAFRDIEACSAMFDDVYAITQGEGSVESNQRIFDAMNYHGDATIANCDQVILDYVLPMITEEE